MAHESGDEKMSHDYAYVLNVI